MEEEPFSDMDFRKTLHNLLRTAALVACVSTAFGATIANGSFGFGSSGGLITVDPPGSILTATSITIPAPSAGVLEQITSIPPTYLTLQNDFATGGNSPLDVGDDVTFDNYTFDLSFGTLPVFFFTAQNGNRFTFTATSGQKDTATLGNSDFLNVAYAGQFSDATSFYDAAAASLSLTFTQSGGATGAITYTGTFATPPLPSQSTPEPTTMVMMGSALIGIGMVGRKHFRHR